MKQTKKLTEGKVKSNIKIDNALKETLPPPSPKCKKTDIPELSDEEIEKWIASTPYYGNGTPEYKEGLEDGAKWAREQLKFKQ